MPSFTGEPPLVVSVHDVSPATGSQTARWCADAAALGIPVSLLVIPGPWRGRSLTADYGAELHSYAARGHEISLHGYTHTAGPEGGLRRLVGLAVARGAAEFAALTTAQAAERLARAADVMTPLRLPTTGVTPPGGLASPAAPGAPRAAGDPGTTRPAGVARVTGRAGRAAGGRVPVHHQPPGGEEPAHRAATPGLRAVAPARRRPRREDRRVRRGGRRPARCRTRPVCPDRAAPRRPG